eukprot:g3686.t1
MAITEPSAPSIRRENRPPPPNVPPPSAPPPQPVAPAPLPPMSMTAVSWRKHRALVSGAFEISDPKVPPPVPTHCNARVEAQPLARDLVDVELHSAKVRFALDQTRESVKKLQETELDAAKVKNLYGGREPQSQRSQELGTVSRPPKEIVAKVEGKNEAKTRSGGEAARGKSGHKGDQHFARSDGGFERNGKGAVRGSGRQWTGNGHWSQDWDEWEETDWKADRGWKGSW